MGIRFSSISNFISCSRFSVSNKAPELQGLINDKRARNKMEAPGLIDHKRAQNKKNNDESSPIFPPEVIIEILSWFPVKSLSKVQLVCKEWRAVIRDRYFIEKHMSCSSFMKHWHNVGKPSTTDTFTYVHGCDGLLLFKNSRSYKYFIWNPAICRVLELPDPHYGTYQFVLSYVPTTSNYRIVSMFTDDDSGGRGCEVFTPGHSKTWRRLAFPDFANANEQHTKKRTFSVVSAGGAVHFVLVIEVGNKIVGEIVTLDLETECFAVNHLPSGLFNDTKTVSEMDWDGKLAFADIVGQEVQFIELEDYKKQRWSEKKKTVPLPFMKKYKYYVDGDVFPLLAKQGQIWFWLRNEKLFMYTIKTGEVTNIKRSYYFSLAHKVYPYKPSLIALEGMVPDTNLERYRCHLRFD